MKTKTLLSLLLFIGIGSTAFAQEGKEPFKKTKSDSIQTKQKKDSLYYYTCPMHIQVKEPSPGKCPICGMTLERRPSASVPRKKDDKECMEIYSCPAHPDLQEVRPGKCPKCGNNLVEKKPG